MSVSSLCALPHTVQGVWHKRVIFIHIIITIWLSFIIVRVEGGGNLFSGINPSLCVGQTWSVSVVIGVISYVIGSPFIDINTFVGAAINPQSTLIVSPDSLGCASHRTGNRTILIQSRTSFNKFVGVQPCFFSYEEESRRFPVEIYLR